jgi:hypothetical protein
MSVTDMLVGVVYSAHFDSRSSLKPVGWAMSKSRDVKMRVKEVAFGLQKVITH